MLRVRKSHTDRLINKEDVRILVPRLRVIFELDLSIVLNNPARTQLHEQAQGGGTSRTAVDPEYHVVLGWVAPAFKKVEKEVASIDVDVPRVRVDGAVAKGGFLDADAVMRKEGMRETSVVCGGEGGEVFEGSEEARIVRAVRVVARGFKDLERGRCSSVCR